MSTRATAHKSRRTKLGTASRIGIKEHLAVYGRAYLSGFMLVAIGFAAGSTAMSLMEAGNAYEHAARNVLVGVDNGIAGIFLRVFFVNAVGYTLVAASGAHFALAPFAGLLMALWGLPFGCAAALLCGIEGGLLCFVICVLLPALLLLPIMLRAWAVALRGARRSLDSERDAELLPSAIIVGLWLLPVSYAQCCCFPALYSFINGLF